MLVVKFHGGLGNQMFQYCFYQYLKNKYGEEQVKADLTRYQYQKFIEHDGFELEKVFENVKLERASRKEILYAGGHWERKNDRAIDVLLKQITQIYSNLNRKSPLKFRKLLDENAWKKYELFAAEKIKKRNLLLYGYWSSYQSKCCFNFVFRKMPETYVLSEIIQTEAVSVHIRRGDYVGTEMDILKDDYYLSAQQYLEIYVNNPKYFIFSDDLEYCKKNLTFLKNKLIVKHNQGNYYDMFLMSQCKYNIIANSTFSYWGAMLNQNKNKIVIMPQFYKNIMFNEERTGWIGI